jgi:hypothetical protein
MAGTAQLFDPDSSPSDVYFRECVRPILNRSMANDSYSSMKNRDDTGGRTSRTVVTGWALASA